MKVSSFLEVINHNNPPGSNPQNITQLRTPIKISYLSRAGTARLLRVVLSIMVQNNEHRALRAILAEYDIEYVDPRYGHHRA